MPVLVSPALAQEPEAMPGDARDEEPSLNSTTDSGASNELAPNLTHRPVTMPAGTLRSELTMGIAGDASDHAAIINLGVAYGITDTLEAGVSGERQGFRRVAAGIVPVFIKPTVGYASPFAYVRGRLFQSSAFELGLEGGIQFPSEAGVRASILIGAPFRLRVGDFFSLDGGVQSGFIFSGPLIYGLDVSLQPRVATDVFYFGANVVLSSAFESGNRFTAIPLGFEAGAVAMTRGARLDIFAAFEWSTFFVADHTRNLSALNLNIWTLTIGIRSYIGLGGVP